MKYISLGSGSRGNATLVLEQNEGVLIDCGFSRKILLERLEQVNIAAEQLSAVFVTHEHGDHSKGVQLVCETFNIPFYCSFGTARQMKWLEHPLWRCITSEQPTVVGRLEVLPITVPHDADEPLQFVIENPEGKRLGILSDLGSITPLVLSHYRQCHALQLEANHDTELLRMGPYPPSLRARVGGSLGHLNNHQAQDLLQKIHWQGLQYVTAGHISEKNNDPELVRVLFSQVLNCRTDEVRLLEQDSPSAWLEIH